MAQMLGKKPFSATSRFLSEIEIELQHPDSLKAFSLSLLNSKAFKKFIEYSTNYSGQIVSDN